MNLFFVVFTVLATKPEKTHDSKTTPKRATPKV